MPSERKILIADDEAPIRKMFSQLIHHLSLDDVTLTLSLAADGQEAVDQVKEMHYDIVFLDLKMPRMNGLEAGRQIKQMSPRTYVVFMTGYAPTSEAKELGDRFYSKPVPIKCIEDSIMASFDYQP